MAKIIWIIVGLIVIGIIFIIPSFFPWITNLYNIIIKLNTEFFSQTPAWFNFGFYGLIIILLIFTARQIQKGN